MNSKIVLLLSLAAFTVADSDEYRYRGYRGYGSGSFESFESYESSEPRYDFDWAVRNKYGNNYGHQEGRDGDNTQGSYYVHLPDGRLQKVDYFVDGNSGYIADVKYEGDASFESGSFESGSYEAPRRYFDSGSFESYEAPRRYFDSGSFESYEAPRRYYSSESREYPFRFFGSNESK